MVVGAQAKSAMVARENQNQAAAIEAPPKYDVESAAGAAHAVAASIDELQGQIQRQNQEAAIRAAERNRLQILVTVAEQRLAEHRDSLSAAERERYDVQQKLVAYQQELNQLEQARSAATNAPPEVIPHLPTPMAKTVFGKEIHFRLLNNEIAYVPWDEMLDRMKADAPNHIAKLRDSARVELSLPVIEGFGARYILRRAEVEMQTRVGVATQSQVELERVYFVQAEQQLGEPLERALQPNSLFRSRLAAYDPQRTTVTVWVYPESFESFRQLKQELFKLGFLTAGRPLPEGFPIGGSPDGSRSTAE
jgi:hypothetical protein